MKPHRCQPRWLHASFECLVCPCGQAVLSVERALELRLRRSKAGKVTARDLVPEPVVHRQNVWYDEATRFTEKQWRWLNERVKEGIADGTIPRWTVERL